MARVFLKVAVLCLLTVTACSPYSVTQHMLPPVDVPTTFESAADSETGATWDNARWWQEFEDPDLNRLVDEALSQNLEVQVAWARLRQAKELLTASSASQYPQINASTNNTRTKLLDEAGGGGAFILSQPKFTTNHFVTTGLSFELDLWKRIASQVTADEYLSIAAQEDVAHTALLLTGSIVELWFQLQEQQALKQLLKQQLRTSENLLELTELRYTVGRGTALDVLQQRAQVAATLAQMPTVEANYETLLVQIATLVGKSPSAYEHGQISGLFPAMPQFPSLNTPSDLLLSRPDLRSQLARLQSSEYVIAVRLAERFPQLSVGLNYNFQVNRSR